MNEKDEIFAIGWNYFRLRVNRSYYVRNLCSIELQRPWIDGCRACLAYYQETGEYPPEMRLPS